MLPYIMQLNGLFRIFESTAMLRFVGWQVVNFTSKAL
jgi:hypothetical protein